MTANTPHRLIHRALRRLAPALALLAAACGAKSTAPPVTASADDWPWWRGPGLNNHAPADQNPPLAWGPDQNVLWKVQLPGEGHASPCIRGNRIFLPTADPAQQTVWLYCLDRETGKTLWQREVYKGKLPKIHLDNSYATATPACDGERVYIPYQTPGAMHMMAFDLEGKPVWNQEVAPYKSIQGLSASPALYGSLVILPVDGAKGQNLFALDRQTGKEVWRSPLPKGLESYASALVANVAGRDQAFYIGGRKTSSYDPVTGKLLWTCDGPAEFCAAVVAFGKDVVYATGGNMEKALLAIRADGSGDVTKTHLLWKGDQRAPYVPSPLLDGDLLYAVNDTGLLRCYEAATGQIVWEENLKAPFYSSPTMAGGRIYLFDRKGKGYVLKPGRKFELIGSGQLPAGAFATPVILGGRIYLRTLKEFYCLGAKP